MIVIGQINGDRCRYREYVYRIPLLSPPAKVQIEEELSLSDRYINALAGIDMNAINMPTLKCQEVAKYRFEMSEDGYRKIVKLFMCPTEYTMATAERQVAEWVFAGPDFGTETMMEDSFQEELLRNAIIY